MVILNEDGKLYKAFFLPGFNAQSGSKLGDNLILSSGKKLVEINPEGKIVNSLETGEGEFLYGITSSKNSLYVCLNTDPLKIAKLEENLKVEWAISINVSFGPIVSLSKRVLLSPTSNGVYVAGTLAGKEGSWIAFISEKGEVKWVKIIPGFRATAVTPTGKGLLVGGIGHSEEKIKYTPLLTPLFGTTLPDYQPKILELSYSDGELISSRELTMISAMDLREEMESKMLEELSIWDRTQGERIKEQQGEEEYKRVKEQVMEELKRKYGLDRKGPIPGTFNPVLIPVDMIPEDGKTYILGKSLVGNFEGHAFSDYLIKLDEKSSVITGTAFWRSLGVGGHVIKQGDSLFVVGIDSGFPIVYKLSKDLQVEWSHMYFPRWITDVITGNKIQWVILSSYYPQSGYILSYSNGTLREIFRLPSSAEQVASNGKELYISNYNGDSVIVLPSNESYQLPNEDNSPPNPLMKPKSFLVPLENGVLVKPRTSRYLYYVSPDGSGYRINYPKVEGGGYNAGKTVIWDDSRVVFVSPEGDKIKATESIKPVNGKILQVIPYEDGLYVLLGNSPSTCLINVGPDGKTRWGWKITGGIFPVGNLKMYPPVDGKLVLKYESEENTTLMVFSPDGSYLGSIEVPRWKMHDPRVISINGSRITVFSHAALSGFRELKLEIRARNMPSGSCNNVPWIKVAPPAVDQVKITYQRTASNVSKVDSIEKLYVFDTSEVAKLEQVKKIQDIKGIEYDNATYILMNEWKPVVTNEKPVIQKTEVKLLPTEAVEITTVYTRPEEKSSNKSKGDICGPGAVVLLATAVLILKRR
ncbi:hypothetical protein A3L09_08135 [Thermococcus profundus]|uniref:Uncharacterized protein n=1 Tax=Thermococcus profundus TaxID=49899 RepID=A0A2Z2MCH1_THEPR|nr:hypothetical protein A3L09_08135 [Thermococcus profundus]